MNTPLDSYANLHAGRARGEPAKQVDGSEAQQQAWEQSRGQPPVRRTASTGSSDTLPKKPVLASRARHQLLLWSMRGLGALEKMLLRLYHATRALATCRPRLFPPSPISMRRIVHTWVVHAEVCAERQLAFCNGWLLRDRADSLRRLHKPALRSQQRPCRAWKYADSIQYMGNAFSHGP